MKTRLLLAAFAAANALASAAQADIIFQDDFEEGRASARWSANTRVTRDAAFSHFNGRYSGGISTLTIAAPPLPHRGSSDPSTGDPSQGGGSGGSSGGGSSGGGSGGGGSGGGSLYNLVTLKFDLYIIDSWDGDDTAYGPDRFMVEVNGKNLFDNTFANQHTYQSYRQPDVGPTHLGFSSASKDSIYRNITITFDPGAAQYLTFDFRDTANQGVGDESWGIDNVQVSYTTVPAPGSAALLGLLGLTARRRRA